MPIHGSLWCYRTLLSDETNRKITDRAPASYVSDPAIISPESLADLLKPHFLDEESLFWMHEATDDLDGVAAIACYDEFRKAREAAIISHIRSVCGVSERIREEEPTE